ncbi:MAG: type II secretion system protein GspC [Pseudomonadota bacterium]
MLTIPDQLGKTLSHGYERHVRWLIPAAQVLLLIAIAIAAARLIWSLVPTPESARWRPATVQTAASTQSNAPKLDLILSAKLFGLYQPQASNLDAAPDTQLNLTLLGIFAGTTDKESRALIGQPSGDEKPYSIGQDIVDGVNLQAIFADRVVLSRNGQLETLRLDKDKPGAEFTGGASSEGVSSGQLSQVRQELLADPNKAAEYIRVQPVNIGGRMKGYRVYPGQNQALFTNAGLRPGDLVTSINGIQLDDTQKAMQMLTDLSKAGSVSIVIDRGGQPQTLNVSFN